MNIHNLRQNKFINLILLTTIVFISINLSNCFSNAEDWPLLPPPAGVDLYGQADMVIVSWIPYYTNYDDIGTTLTLKTDSIPNSHSDGISVDVEANQHSYAFGNLLNNTKYCVLIAYKKFDGTRDAKSVGYCTHTKSVGNLQINSFQPGDLHEINFPYELDSAATPHAKITIDSINPDEEYALIFSHLSTPDAVYYGQSNSEYIDIDVNQNLSQTPLEEAGRWDCGAGYRVSRRASLPDHTQIETYITSSNNLPKCSSWGALKPGDIISDLKLDKYALGLTDDEPIQAEVLVNSANIVILHDITTESQIGDLEEEELINSAEEIAADFEDLIYPRMNANLDKANHFCGGKLYVLFSSAYSIPGGTPIGQFRPQDYFADSVNTMSNEAPLLYMMLPGFCDKNEVSATIAHEYTHLRNFELSTYDPIYNGEFSSTRTMNNDIFMIPLAIDEGFAYLMENLVGLGDGDFGSYLTISNYLKQPYYTSLHYTFMSNNGGHYGLYVLFINYILEQIDHFNWNTDDYLSVTDRPFFNIQKDFRTTGYDDLRVLMAPWTINKNNDTRTFSQLFHDYAIAVFNDKFDENLNDDSRYNFKPQYIDELTNVAHGYDMSSQTIGSYCNEDPFCFGGIDVRQMKNTSLNHEMAKGSNLFIALKTHNSDLISPLEIDINLDLLDGRMKASIMRVK